jgi:hypothetical protein
MTTVVIRTQWHLKKKCPGFERLAKRVRWYAQNETTSLEPHR